MTRTHLLTATLTLCALTLTGCAPSTSTQSSTDTSSNVPAPTIAPFIPSTPDAKPADPANYTVSKNLGSAPDIKVNTAAGNVSNLYVSDIVTGSGTPVVSTDKVTVHYTGIAATTGIQFDSSWPGGQPVTFGLNEVIRGWTEGLVGMKPGGRRLLVIPASLAYGDYPTSPDIKPGETLIFVVDLVAISK